MTPRHPHVSSDAVITGDGYFGTFMFRICVDRSVDTVEMCPAWAEHLSRPALVEAMVLRAEVWEAVTSFYEAVMLAKEEAAREMH